MVLRYSKPPSQRQLRVAENVKEAVSEVFLKNELSLPLLEKNFITVSEARISSDLKLATVFVASITDSDEGSLVECLNSHAGQIRHSLAKKIKLRFVPTIRFIYDKSFDNGAKIDSLLHKTKL